MKKIDSNSSQLVSFSMSCELKRQVFVNVMDTSYMF